METGEIKNKGIESRTISTTFSTEVRNADGGGDVRTVSGYALLFDSETDMGGFREVIRREAVNDIISKSDIRALKNHDPNIILARSKYGKGTLDLSIDDKGLRFSFDMPHSREDLLEEMERGDIDQCSFRFQLNEDGQRWTEAANGDKPLRELTGFRALYDVSVVTFPAYEDTTVALEARDKWSTEINSEKTKEVNIKNDAEVRRRELDLMALTEQEA